MAFITDRTESDALLGNEKGVYSYTDLNRVESAVKRISDEMALGLTTKTDWNLPSVFSVKNWPVESQMKRYLLNVSVVRKYCAVTIPLPTSMDRLTWQGANDIERVLSLCMERVEGIKQTYRYSGEFYAGEELL